MELRRTEALGLRIKGATYREIADTLKSLEPEQRESLGVTDSYAEPQAYRDVNYELDRIRVGLAEKGERLMSIEMRRLEELYKTTFSNYETFNNDVAYVPVLLSIHDRIVRLAGLAKDKGPDRGLTVPTPDGAVDPNDQQQQLAAVVEVPVVAATVEEWMKTHGVLSGEVGKE